MKSFEKKLTTPHGVLGSVLLIDDELLILQVYKTLLTAARFTVETATNYEDALACIEKKDYHLIITDLRMSGKNGIELIQEVRRRGLTCEVVVITGHPELETAQEALRQGAMDYLTKPVFKEDLLRVCHLATGRHRLKQKKAALAKNMEAVMRSLQDGVIVLDDEQQVLFANDAAMHLCELADPCIGLPLEQALQKSATLLKKTIANFLATPTPPTIQSITLPSHNDQPSQVISLSRDTLLDDWHHPLGTILMLKCQAHAHAPATRPPPTPIPGLLGNTPAMHRIFHLVETLAGLETTVLVTGESGTGKELIAEALHTLGNRRNQPFVAVNCAAIPDTLLESELFGHVRGSFTGASRDHVGKLQQADRGTVFLDEIGDTSPAMQTRLLRFLEKREIQRLGDERLIRVNTRVIAATNRTLATMVQEHTFRQDLYYRLKVVEIHLPPLRERREDIPLLVNFYLDHFAKKFNKPINHLAPEVMALFMDYHWPGNVRELVHVLERATIMGQAGNITKEEISLEHSPSLAPTTDPYTAFKLNREILRQVLDKNHWNITDTAKELGISRTTVYRKMSEFAIDR